jgi:hypothetical protein
LELIDENIENVLNHQDSFKPFFDKLTLITQSAATV